ncbi:MAG: hypothetical protein Q8L14_06835 [Myxococcales bacterium]|nr:hypothetical protein [Myxococcales bacterium]
MRALQKVVQTDAAMTNELNRERANGLGRTGRLIEDAIAACAALSEKLATCPAGHTRAGLLAEYAEHRRIAIEQRWYLEVQREAMGLRKQTDLDTFFPLPPPIRE